MMHLPINELRLLVADAAVLEWMDDPDNRQYLHQLKMEYLHDKGWSTAKGKHFKRSEYFIPQTAFLLLSEEMRQPKEKAKWIKERHPYLMLTSL